MVALTVAASGDLPADEHRPPPLLRQKSCLQTPKAEYFQQQSILADSPLDRAQFENQLQILKSKAIAIAVINQLKLVDDPDFDASAQPVPKLFARIRGLFATPKPAPKREARPDQGPDDGLIDAFEAKLKAERVGYSSVIEVTFSSSSPERAAQITNAVANTYIADQLNAQIRRQPDRPPRGCRNDCVNWDSRP